MFFTEESLGIFNKHYDSKWSICKWLETNKIYDRKLKTVTQVTDHTSTIIYSDIKPCHNKCMLMQLTHSKEWEYQCTRCWYLQIWSVNNGSSRAEKNRANYLIGWINCWNNIYFKVKLSLIHCLNSLIEWRSTAKSKEMRGIIEFFGKWIGTFFPPLHMQVHVTSYIHHVHPLKFLPFFFIFVLICAVSICLCFKIACR